MTTLSRFKAAMRKGVSPPSGRLCKTGTFATRVLPHVGERCVGFTISTGSVDRDNDVVSVDGWDFDNFRRNPVVLWGHDGFELPIARCVSVGVEEGEVRAVAEFVPADMPVVGPRAEAVYRMCQSGFLSATSVGFRPLEAKVASDRMEDGDDWWPAIDFLRSELMEFSIVSIPANPEALIDPASLDAPLLASAGDLQLAEALATAERADAAARRHDLEKARRRLMLACV